MTATYNTNTDVGKVRALVGDTNMAEPLLYDEEIQVMLDLEDGVKLAAAQALDTIASRQVLLLKVIKILDLQTDAASMARALRDHALKLREQAYADDDSCGFEIAENAVLTPFQWSENLLNIFRREEG